MKVLIIKMTSMGDIIHAFPALTDAGKAIPNIKFDWVVEEPFKQLPLWHPLVKTVYPVALRRWRKNIFKTAFSQEFRDLIKLIRKNKYDLIIDAQGLLKSAIVSRCFKGVVHSYNSDSARESFATFLYHKKHQTEASLHAIERVRQLFSKSLGYEYIGSIPDYGLTKIESIASEKYLIFLPNTTWDTKHWPEAYWKQLVKIAGDAGWDIFIPWGNDKEKSRAERLSQEHDKAMVLPKMNLNQVTQKIVHATAVVALDTGLTHISAAYSVPTVSLYGPTNPVLTGAIGLNQKHLSALFSCAPCLQRRCTFNEETIVKPACFEAITPKIVWQELQSLLP